MNINITTSKNDTAILNALTPIFIRSNTNLGKYTLVTVSLLEATNFTDVVTILLKKFHIERPINTNTGKYSTLDLKTIVAIKVYISINASGSKIIHKNPKYEFITSVLSSAHVAYII